MYRETSRQILPLTPQLAEKVRDMQRIRGERPLKSSRKSHLKREIEKGKFYGPVWAFATCDGVEYCVNGQHSSHLLCECENFPQSAQVVIIHFACDTQRDLSDLYSTFDDSKSARTGVEKVNAAMRTTTDLDEVSKTHGRFIASGLAYFLNGLSSKGPFTTEGMETLPLEHTAFTCWANLLIGKASFRRAVVVAAMFATYKTNEDEATTFWNLVKNEDHPSVKHPSRVLAKFLNESYGKRQIEGTNSSQQWSQEAHYRKCVLAWNAYMRGATSDLKYYKNSVMPKLVSVREEERELAAML